MQNSRFQFLMLTDSSPAFIHNTNKKKINQHCKTSEIGKYGIKIKREVIKVKMIQDSKGNIEVEYEKKWVHSLPSAHPLVRIVKLDRVHFHIDRSASVRALKIESLSFWPFFGVF